MAHLHPAFRSTDTHQTLRNRWSTRGLFFLLNTWHQIKRTAFDTYRPELHYMRGPGPASDAKRKAIQR